MKKEMEEEVKAETPLEAEAEAEAEHSTNPLLNATNVTNLDTFSMSVQMGIRRSTMLSWMNMKRCC